jgi:hypothetical protein
MGDPGFATSGAIGETDRPSPFSFDLPLNFFVVAR